MYIHPADHLAMFEADAVELRRAAAQERLMRRVLRERRAAQPTRLARFAAHLSRAALRPRHV